MSSNKIKMPVRGYEASWQNVAKSIAAKNLSGLQVLCPKCAQSGTLFSKWVKGTPIKPLYVIHINWNGHFQACLLDKKHADYMRPHISINSKDVLKILRTGKAFVLFSGGKDSLCLLDYMKRLGKWAKKEIAAIHADTTAGFPEIEEYVEEVCEKLGVHLITVRPTHDYFDLAKRWGIPGVKSRWCCETLKIAPIKKFLAKIEGPKVVFDGIRAAESNVRATYTPIWFHPSFRCVSVSPIFKWSDQKVESYIKRNNLPVSPAASLGTSAECWCGAYKRKCDFEALLNVNPDIFDKLIEVEEAQHGKYTFIYENGKRISLASLKANNKELIN